MTIITKSPNIRGSWILNINVLFNAVPKISIKPMIRAKIEPMTIGKILIDFVPLFRTFFITSKKI